MEIWDQRGRMVRIRMHIIETVKAVAKRCIPVVMQQKHMEMVRTEAEPVLVVVHIQLWGETVLREAHVLVG